LKDTSFSDNPILDDGWYRGLTVCNNGSALSTSDQKRYVWVRVEAGIVRYFGYSKSRSWQNEDLLVNRNINRVPFVEIFGGKIFAKYNFVDNVSASCEIEILLSKKS